MLQPGRGLSLSIDPRLSIAPARLRTLQALFDELGPRALPTGAAFLRRIDIVPDIAAMSHINALIAAHSGHAGKVTLGSHGPQGVTVPVDAPDGLYCHIVLTESLVQAIDPSHPYGPDLVSTLLEELRHVEYYARTWQRRGFVQPTAQHVDFCLVDLYAIANKLLDEYLVNRWKAQLLGTEALIEGAEGMTTAVIVYPEPIAAVVERSTAALAMISAAWDTGRTDAGETWHNLLGWLWRAVFEPLTYDAGRRAPWASAEDVLAAPADSAFFRRLVAPYWAAILGQFARAYASDTEADDALDRVVATLRGFVAALGVSIRPHGNGCWVDIEDRFDSWQ